MGTCLTIAVTAGGGGGTPSMQVTNLTVSPSSVPPGQAVGLTSTVKNNGTATSGNWRVAFTITLPSGGTLTRYSNNYLGIGAGVTVTTEATQVVLTEEGANQICAAVVAVG